MGNGESSYRRSPSDGGVRAASRGERAYVLYARYLEGDDTGMEEIIRDFKDGLILYLNSFTRDLRAAEELCEDTFVKLAVKKPRFSGKSTFKTFLYAIGRNVALDYLKKQKNHIPSEEISEISADVESLETVYIKEERKRQVHRALEHLKPEYAQVLWLTYFEELSNKETAEVMKKSVHAVETLVYRARNALKDELEKEGFIYEDL